MEEKKKTSFKLDPALVKRLARRCFELEVTQTSAVEAGIRWYLEQHADEAVRKATPPESFSVQREHRQMFEVLKAIAESQDSHDQAIWGAMRAILEHERRLHR